MEKTEAAGLTSRSRDGIAIEQGSEEMSPAAANRYATKKTVAQGCYDVALLTMNAAQLKRALEQGHRHPFYALVVVLASVSIALQVIVGVLLIVLGCLDLGKPRQRGPAIALNNVATAFVMAVTIANVLAASFDLSHSNYESLTPTAFAGTELNNELTTRGL
ncbi:ninjurin-2-like [Dermacentor variabilis]|uniref:ninjurin-2-like n=1 Tax=Dermacentor variabilis TaxID=34621 RepID=UPI003F5B4DE0